MSRRSRASLARCVSVSSHYDSQRFLTVLPPLARCYVHWLPGRCEAAGSRTRHASPICASVTLEISSAAAIDTPYTYPPEHGGAAGWLAERILTPPGATTTAAAAAAAAAATRHRPAELWQHCCLQKQ